MKTVSIDIPAPPDGYEAFHATEMESADFYYAYGCKSWVPADKTRRDHFGVLARRKPTLADWANEQPDLKAWARLFPCLDGDFGVVFRHKGEWEYCCRYWPKPKCDGEIQVICGKWVDL